MVVGLMQDSFGLRWSGSDVEYYLNVEKYEKKWILSFFIDCRGKCFLRRDKRIIKDR